MIKTRALFSLLSSAAFLFALFLVTACDDMSADQRGGIAMPEMQSYPNLAPYPPPKPQFEQPPLLDSPRTTVWRPGYWSWNAGTYSWVPGEIISKPDPTAVWYPDHWLHHTYGWAFVCGHWE